MAEPTETCEDFVQREMDKELRLVDEFLMGIACTMRDMSQSVAGLRVTVKSIVEAMDAMKIPDNHPQDDIQTSTQEEETHAQPCPKVEEEEKSAVEEEQMEQTQREEEEPEESNLSSDLRESLNNTLGGLEQAEKKLIEMDCRNYVAKAAGQPSGDSTCHLDFMCKFLANFRQKLMQSCEEFKRMESQELALLQERKALKDLSLQLANSPRKATNPKENSTASTVKGTTAQKTNKEDKAPSDAETAPPKGISEDSSPSDTAASQEDGDSKDNTSADMRSAATQRSNTEDTASMDDNATPQKGDPMHRTPSDPKGSIQHGDDKGAFSNIKMTPPKDASAASTTEGSHDDQKYPGDQTVLDDDEFDFVSPEGMKRMFGTLSQESKIQFSPACPIRATEDSPTESRINHEVSPVGGANES